MAFLARYNGRTLEEYRQDLRFFFAWTGSVGLEVLAAARPHIELFRHHMEQRGLSASTIDRRLATVGRLYRFAHIDGRIVSNPAQYVRRPKVHPSHGHGMEDFAGCLVPQSGWRAHELCGFAAYANRVLRAHGRWPATPRQGRIGRST